MSANPVDVITESSHSTIAKVPVAPRPLPAQPRPAKKLAPRGAAWWWGAAVLALAVLLLSFVAYASVFSWLQFNRAQTLEYNDLRSSLAQATTPVGQLDNNGHLVAPGTPIALLIIPSLGLSQVIDEGTTGSVLRSGPGHRRDSVMPGQAGVSVLMGRQTTFGGPFGSISQLVPGATITVTTGQGLSTFRVIDVRHQNDPAPTAVSVTGGRLELITADGLPLLPVGGLYVDAELVSKVQTTPSLVMTYPALPVEERAMGQDAAAWGVAGAAFALFLLACLVLGWLWRGVGSPPGVAHRRADRRGAGRHGGRPSAQRTPQPDLIRAFRGTHVTNPEDSMTEPTPAAAAPPTEPISAYTLPATKPIKDLKRVQAFLKKTGPDRRSGGRSSGEATSTTADSFRARKERRLVRGPVQICCASDAARPRHPGGA